MTKRPAPKRQDDRRGLLVRGIPDDVLALMDQAAAAETIPRETWARLVLVRAAREFTPPRSRPRR